jgi:hypothetical protein
LPRIPHNIERLPGRSYWTGYGAGIVWRIRRSGAAGWWAAAAPGTGTRGDAAPTLRGRTLADIGQQLDNLPRIPNDEELTHGL